MEKQLASPAGDRPFPLETEISDTEIADVAAAQILRVLLADTPPEDREELAKWSQDEPHFAEQFRKICGF